MPPDRNSEAVQFVEPNALDRPGLPIGEDSGLVDKIGLGLLELTEDFGRADLYRWHGCAGAGLNGSVLHLKGAQVVTTARQRDVSGTPRRRLIRSARP